MRENIPRDWFGSLPFLHPDDHGELIRVGHLVSLTHLLDSFGGAAANSAAAFAKPCRASVGALREARSSDSSSEDGPVLDTVPYVAYLCGCGYL